MRGLAGITVDLLRRMILDCKLWGDESSCSLHFWSLLHFKPVHSIVLHIIEGITPWVNSGCKSKETDHN